MKVVIDFDDPDAPPLMDLLRILQIARIQHEVAKDHNMTRAAQRLGINRTTVWRACWSRGGDRSPGLT